MVRSENEHLWIWEEANLWNLKKDGEYKSVSTTEASRV